MCLVIPLADVIRLVGSAEEANRLQELALQRPGRELLSLHNPSAGGSTIIVSPDGEIFTVIGERVRRSQLSGTLSPCDSGDCESMGVLDGLRNESLSFLYGEWFVGNAPSESLEMAVKYGDVEFTLEEILSSSYTWRSDAPFWESVFAGRGSMPLRDLLAFWMRLHFRDIIDGKLDQIAPDRYDNI